MKHLAITLLLTATALLYGCKTDYANLPTYSGSRQLQAVVEIPAGSNRHVKYNLQTQEFSSGEETGKVQEVEFLPFPGNYGFIPSTEVGKDGDGLPILVLSERVETATVLEVIAIGILQLEKQGELHPIVVAVPARPSERTINATTMAEFAARYPAAQVILREWFVNTKKAGATKFVAWRDEKFADKEIQRWMKL